MSWLYQLNQLVPENFPGWIYGSMARNPSTLNDFSIGQIVKLLVPQRIGNVKILNNHNYPRDACTPATAAAVDNSQYVNHITNVQMVASFADSIAAAKSVGALYHMGETNTVACHGVDGVSNTQGALLWQLDYALEGANVGMDRLFFHNGVGNFYYSFWEVGNASIPAQVNPTYYGTLFMAEVTKGLKSPRRYRVKSLDSFALARYAIYEEVGERRKEW